MLLVAFHPMLYLLQRYILQVPFLSIGGDYIGERHTRHHGNSEFSGSFVVEDYIGDGNVWCRQLLFLKHGTQVQSVTRLVKKPASEFVLLFQK